MPFYVAVGPRGFIFRAGMLLTGVMGRVTYWCATRRRFASTQPSVPANALRSAPDSSAPLAGALDNDFSGPHWVRVSGVDEHETRHTPGQRLRKDPAKREQDHPPDTVSDQDRGPVSGKCKNGA